MTKKPSFSYLEKSHEGKVSNVEKRIAPLTYIKINTHISVILSIA